MVIKAEDFQYVIEDGSAAVKSYLGNKADVAVPEEIEVLHATYPVIAVTPYAFYENDVVRRVQLGGGITSIGDSAFRSCGFLEEVVFSDGLQSVGTHAFSDCEKLTKIRFPNTVTEIGAYALKNDPSLEEVTLPVGITVLQEGILEGSRSLSNVVLPARLLEIRNSAFYGSGISNVVFNEALYKIEYLAFQGCDRLTDVWLPKEIVSCSAAAFEQTIRKHTVAGSLTAKELTEKGIGHEEYTIMDGVKTLCFSLKEEGRDRIDIVSNPILKKEEWEAVPVGANLFEDDCRGRMIARKPGATMVSIQKVGHPAMSWLVEAKVGVMYLETHMYFVKVGEQISDLGIMVNPYWLGPWKASVEIRDPEILKKEENGVLTGAMEGLTKIEVAICCFDGFWMKDSAYVKVDKPKKIRRTAIR